MSPEDDSEFDGKSTKRKDNFAVVEKIQESCVLEDCSRLGED